jgi:4-aminobutyrate aminotransferase/(S)-3-amino-2-methylpropionate transaminase
MMTTRETLDLLRAYESRNVLFTEADGSWPIVWERAQGALVWDAEGKKYLDLTGAFGVAAAGHANPAVVKAGHDQMARLMHAMGDVHPQKTGKVVFGNSGFEAVEAALKTARLATGKPGVIAFEGGYHGLGYGALNATHRELFRGPFKNQLREFGHFVPFPKKPSDLATVDFQLRQHARRERIGAVLVEPVQARGGIQIPPPEFLPFLRQWCDRTGALLILDEIYTGFGRTGKWFACEHSGVTPDLICLGKALTGGFPLSACVGRAALMDAAWPASQGEAIHTSTFLGHPVGCAMALAQLGELRRLKLPERSAKLGAHLLKLLATELPSLKLRTEIRGLGLMAGVELTRRDGQPAAAEALQAIKTLLHRGYIFLPEGEHGNIISFTPPLTITKAQLKAAVRALAEVLL